ncbi:hypothetical protein F0L74_21865 [Chitinophaga agrisoli]|uniref:Uncharacterized protein n=1 Tax=Chitinophaga agrisoli TaxID=2607653 RepID=A0A5B2VIX9_9BACT|nr:hypothetical protein [Chitinophaga agrisoli]KAA2238864.1 hypothetical protein F0L74_21865 [Chitinophaga agrisoli]
MQPEPPSIFDQDFLQERYVRRSKLLPLALKIYVWVFLFLGIKYMYNIFDFYRLVLTSWGDDPSQDWLRMVVGLLSLTIGVVIFLSNLLILLERKYAIVFAVVVTGLSIIASTAGMVQNLASGHTPARYIVTELFWTLIKIPYIILLLKIKQPWERSAVPGNHAGQGD